MRTLMVAALVAAFALLPGSVAAHGGSEVAITGHPHADGPIEIEGTEFEPDAVVTLELRKEGEPAVLLGSVPVEADGTFTVTLHVPAEVRPGLYQLLAQGGDESVSAEATILEPLDGSVPGGAEAPVEDISNDRPSGETVGLAIVTAVVALLGAAIVFLGRREAARPFQAR